MTIRKLPWRRLLLLPALALVVLGAPVLAAVPAQTPAPTTEEVPIAPAGAPVTTGWQSEPTPVEANLVGVTWKGDPDATFTIEARGPSDAASPEAVTPETATPGSTTPDTATPDTAAPENATPDAGIPDPGWTDAATVDEDVGLDAGTKDAKSAAKVDGNATEPVWIGDDATEVRVTLVSGTAEDVTLAAVDPSPTTASDGAAGAFDGLAVAGSSGERYGFAALLFAAALVLGAIALGWSPWRGRRRRAVLVATVVAAGALALSACVPVAGPPTGGSGGGGGPGGVPPGAPAMISRAQWGAQTFGTGPVPCPGGPEYAPKLLFAVVHHTVNSNNYSPSQSAAMVRSIQQYHMGTNGYCDIAYNFVIDRYGQIFEGRAGGVNKPVIGGHAGGFNTASTGVALLGDNSSTPATPAQWNALVALLQWRLSVGRVDPAAGFTTTVRDSPCNCQNWPVGTVVSFPNAIVGHGDVDQTGCPGAAVASQLGALRAQVQPGISIPPPVEVSLGAAAATGASHVDVIVRGGNGGAARRSTDDGTTWSPYADLPGSMSVTSRIVAATRSSGEVVAIARNQSAGLGWQVVGGPGWDSVPAVITSDPAAAADGSGGVHVIVRGSDNSYLEQVLTGSSWSGWEALGGIFTSDPAVAFDPTSGHVFAVGRGGNGSYFVNERGASWSGWTSLGGTFTSDPAIVADSTGRILVVGRGPGNAFFVSTRTGGTWSAFESLGGTLTSDPTVVADEAGNVYVFGRGGNGAYYETVRDTAGTWSSWAGLGGVLTSDPAAVVDGSGRVYLFGRGGDRSLFWQRRVSGTWSGWAGLGGVIDSVYGID